MADPAPRPTPCSCKSGYADNPQAHNNQVRNNGRCMCECHQGRR